MPRLFTIDTKKPTNPKPIVEKPSIPEPITTSNDLPADNEASLLNNTGLTNINGIFYSTLLLQKLI